MFQVIIIEDEKANLDYLKMLVTNNKQFICRGAFQNSQEAMDKVDFQEIDAVFLDIELSAMNGIQLARIIKGINPEIAIVYTTAYEKYAVEAFQIDALHYLMKPITREDMESVVLRLEKEKNHKCIVEYKYYIHTFGGFRVTRTSTEESILWSTKKAEELFAYFLFRKSQKIEKRKLSELLWPDTDYRTAQHNLHSALYRMKSSLKVDGYDPKVIFSQEVYTMDLEEFGCDAYEFMEFVRNRKSLTIDNLKEYEKFFELYKGEVFQEKNYQWAYGWQLEISLEYWNITKELLEHYKQQNQLNKAEALLINYISYHPIDEEAHDQLMNIFYLTGNRRLLMETYHSLKKSLKQEIQLEPRHITQRLYEKYLSEI